MFIIFPSTVMSGDIQVDQYIPEIRRRFELNTLIISMSNGHEYWFKNENLKKYSVKDGSDIYVYTFPNNMEELTKHIR